ncbi:hypothetical protein GQX74_014475 [Glossina fuscipes]|nr:hypothetical protein GQX74_014475 [Glossina fuscipes]
MYQFDLDRCRNEYIAYSLQSFIPYSSTLIFGIKIGFKNKIRRNSLRRVFISRTTFSQNRELELIYFTKCNIRFWTHMRIAASIVRLQLVLGRTICNKPPSSQKFHKFAAQPIDGNINK